MFIATIKVAGLDFLGSMLPHFERLLHRHQQRYRNKVATAVLNKDKNML